MLPESGFLATVSLVFHFKNRVQPIPVIHPSVALSNDCLNLNDGDAMINDAGKHEVKIHDSDAVLAHRVGWRP